MAGNPCLTEEFRGKPHLEVKKIKAFVLCGARDVVARKNGRAGSREAKGIGP